MVKLRRHTAEPTECVSCGREPARGDDPSRWKTIRRRGVRGPECPRCFNSHEHQRDDGVSDPRQYFHHPLAGRDDESSEPDWKSEARQRGEAASAELLAGAGRDAPESRVLADSGGCRLELVAGSRPTLRVDGACGLCGVADRPPPRQFARVVTPMLLAQVRLDAPRCHACAERVATFHDGDVVEFVAAQVGKPVADVADTDVWSGDAWSAALRGLPVFPNAGPWGHVRGPV